MENPKRPELKIRQFSNPEKTFVTNRYVIENEEDLKKTLESFPQLSNNTFKVAENWKRSLDEGRILLITDEHPMSGFPTYCFESTKDSTHVNSLIRL